MISTKSLVENPTVLENLAHRIEQLEEIERDDAEKRHPACYIRNKQGKLRKSMQKYGLCRLKRFLMESGSWENSISFLLTLGFRYLSVVLLSRMLFR